MFRTIGDPVSLWESLLPAEVLRLPEELARVDALLDDPVFFAPFVPFFSVTARPSTPMECYLRMMFLKFRYRLGFESVCAEVSDSITWRRFCRIPIDGPGAAPDDADEADEPVRDRAVDGLNEALLAKAAGAEAAAHLPAARGHHGRPGQCVLPDGLGAAGQGGPADRRDWPPDPGRRRRNPDRVRDRSGAAGKRAHAIAAKLRCAGAQGREENQAAVARVTGELADLAGRAARDAGGCSAMRAGHCAAPRRKPRPWPPPGSPMPPRAGGGDGCAARSMTWPGSWRRPGRSPRRPGSGSPGMTPAGATRRVSLHEPTPGRSPRAASASRSSSATRARSPTTTTASSWTTPCSRATPPTPRSSPPPSSGSSSGPARTPDRHRRPRLRREGRRRRPAQHGRPHRRDPPQGQTRQGPPGRRAPARIPAHREMADRQRGPDQHPQSGYGWDRTRLDGTEGARIWAGHGILAHNLVKIALWPADAQYPDHHRLRRTGPRSQPSEFFRSK